jgi:hypothetical protein
MLSSLLLFAEKDMNLRKYSKGWSLTTVVDPNLPTNSTKDPDDKLYQPDFIYHICTIPQFAAHRLFPFRSSFVLFCSAGDWTQGLHMLGKHYTTESISNWYFSFVLSLFQKSTILCCEQWARVLSHLPLWYLLIFPWYLPYIYKKNMGINFFSLINLSFPT